VFSGKSRLNSRNTCIVAEKNRALVFQSIACSLALTAVSF